MEVEYLSEMSESLYQNARCHTPHHHNTETTTFVTGQEEKWVVLRFFKYTLLFALWKPQSVYPKIGGYSWFCELDHPF